MTVRRSYSSRYYVKFVWSWIAIAVLSACTSPEPGARSAAGWGDLREASGSARAVCGGVVCHEHAGCSGSGAAAVCTCLDGYEGDGTECTDVDECTDASWNDCGPGALCINTPGSFRCECAPGFVGDGRTCEDVDECAGESNVCDPNATCDNTDSGFSCTCNPGFQGDGLGCGDVDECADPSLHACPDNAHCVNVLGSYDCRCDAGFTGSTPECPSLCGGEAVCRSLCDVALEDRETCAEQGRCRVVGFVAVCDACVAGHAGDGITCAAAACDAACDGAGDDDAPHAVCAADGSCVCAPGFEGVTGSCTDLDECAAEPGVCGPHAACTNLEGGFLCACDAGYVRESGVCVDFDECTASTGLCHPDAECINLTREENPAGYECQCRSGFTGDGLVCTDIDECLTDNGGCPSGSTCVNLRGSSTCECRAPLVGDPSNCHCDLTGVWAMRHDVDVCWGARTIEGTAQNLISAGSMEASVWELHEITYDGQEFRLRAKGCGADNSPDLISPLFRETYSAYVPFATFDKMTLAAASPFVRAGIVPGVQFSTPSMAGVLGIDLGSDPVNAPWPDSQASVSAGQWVDSDGDGEPGFTLWSRLPSQPTESGTRNYSYLPARPAVGATSIYIDQRAGCLSVAARVITHLDVTVESCTRLRGEVINEKTEGRVHSCSLVDKGTCDPDNPNDCTGWKQDIACTPGQWSSAARCNAEDIARLDDDQNQTQHSKATFELIKIGSIGEALGCADVRDALPAIVRPVPTITCTTP
jgi:hypothetical protein